MNRIALTLKGLTDKGFFHLLSANFVIGFLAFGSQLLVAKFLSPEEIGRIKTMQSYIGIATILAGFGFNTAVLKLCSERRPDPEKGFILKRNLLYTVVPLAAVLAIIAIAASLGWTSPDSKINRWLVVFMLMLPGSAYTALLIGYLQARKRIHLMAYAQTTVRVAGAALLVAATYLFGFPGFVYTSVAVSTAAIIPLFGLVKQDLKHLSKVANPFRKSFYYAKWSTANNTLGTVASFLDILFLNFMVSDRTEFGYYGIATIFVVGLNSVTTTVQKIAMPYFSEKSGDEREFRRVLNKYQKQLVMLTGGVALASIVIVPEFIKIVYGKSYSPAGVYFQILAVKYFFWSCSVLYSAAIWGIGRMQSLFSCLAAMALFSAVALYLLISKFDIMGAAIAQTLSHGFLFVLVYFTARHVVSKHFSELNADSGIGR